MHPVLVALCLFGVLFVGFYLAFLKKLLPKPLARCAAHIYFWPCITCTIIGQTVKYRGWYTENLENESPPVILGGAPFDFLGKVDQLHALGVRASVNMCEEYEGPVRKYSILGWEQLRLRCVDHEEPSVAQLHEAVEFIRGQRESGNGVYIHCKAGHGRGAAVAFAWLLASQGQSLEETQIKLRSYRRVRKGLWKQPNIIRYHAEICEEMQPIEQEVNLSAKDTAAQAPCDEDETRLQVDEESPPSHTRSHSQDSDTAETIPMLNAH